MSSDLVSELEGLQLNNYASSMSLTFVVSDASDVLMQS